MAKNIELLLLKTVENLGIVGDVVRVKPGFARNYLLPMGMAERPTPAKIESLKEARAQAETEQSELRSMRERIIERLQDVSVSMERSCNDQGALYGSVTQRDITDALNEAGYGVDVKSIRLTHPIRRVGTYPIVVQFEKDLRTEVTLVVDPDHELVDEEAEREARQPAEGERGHGGPRGVPLIDALATDEEIDAMERKRERRRERREHKGGRR
jgi:large subunit ribosomal protein L9